MGTARDVVLDLLSTLAVDIAEVRPYARLTRQPAKRTLMVRVDDIEPEAQMRTYKFSLIVLGTRFVTDDDKVGGVDDELDDAVEAILAVLDKGTTDLIWTSCKRGTYEATNSPCYIIATQFTGTYEQDVTP
jgi:hypothetical protein